MSWLPGIIDMILKGKRSSDSAFIPIEVTDEGAAKVELSTAQKPVFPGAAPPADISGESLWLNTNAGAEGLYFYDLTRAKWLESGSRSYLWGDDAADNQVMRSIGVNTPGDGSGYLLPVATDITLVGLYAHARAGNQAKSFDIRRREPGGVISVLTTFSMAATGASESASVNETLNIDVAAGGDAFIDVFAEAAGASSQDVTIQLIYRRRGA